MKQGTGLFSPFLPREAAKVTRSPRAEEPWTPEDQKWGTIILRKG